MNTKEIAKRKKSLKLTKYQRELLTGKLLGDGHLETQDNGRTYRLKVEHSIKQKGYVDWFHEQFKKWTGAVPYTRVSKLGVKYGFATYSHGALRFYAKQFYVNGRKVIPRLIRKLMTPTSLAIWYMDDGSWKSNRHRTFIIHSHGYKRGDLVRIQEALARLGIKTNLHKQIRDIGEYWRIYVLSESADRFRNLITPAINQIPSMSYKLGNKLPKE